MQAVILLGGRGTRLQALYPDRPKALVPIAGKPFLQWQIEWLARGGVTDFHLAAGHLADVLRAWVEEKGGSVFQVSGFRFQVSGVSLNVTLSVEPAPLGTAGGLKFAEPFIRSDPFLAINGDSLLPNLDFQALEKTAAIFPNIGKNAGGRWTAFFRLRRRASAGQAERGLPSSEKPGHLPDEPLATIAVARIEEAGRYGTVEFDAEGRVTAFREKAERKAGWINGGVYLASRRMLDLIEPGRNLSLETDLFPSMAQRGLLRSFQAKPPLLDMGTPEGIRTMEAWLGK